MSHYRIYADFIDELQSRLKKVLIGQFGSNIISIGFNSATDSIVVSWSNLTNNNPESYSFKVISSEEYHADGFVKKFDAEFYMNREIKYISSEMFKIDDRQRG
ncbi:hypothetical protein Q4R15_11785 [Morganella morganii]|nr:hypothetical protein [Morganella morganii]